MRKCEVLGLDDAMNVVAVVGWYSVLLGAAANHREACVAAASRSLGYKSLPFADSLPKYSYMAAYLLSSNPHKNLDATSISRGRISSNAS